MATDNFIVSSLPDYVKENRDVLIDQVVLRGPTIRRMAKQTGIKKSAYLNYLDVRPVLQPGAGCGFTPQGEIELTDRELNVAVIKINMDVCPDKLRGTFAEYLIRTRAGEQPLPYEQEITDAITAFIAETLEKAIWQGDTTSQDANLSNFDGILKIAAGEAAVVTVNVAAGSTMRAAIAATLAAIPAAARKRGAKINVAPELFEAYLQELVNANLYHYSGPQDEDPEEWVIHGSNVRVVRTEGLEGTLKLVATYDRNLYYGTDLENDLEVFDIKYDDTDEVFHIKVRWTSGVQIAFPDRVVVATLAESPAGTTPLVEAVQQIAGCVCAEP